MLDKRRQAPYRATLIRRSYGGEAKCFEVLGRLIWRQTHLPLERDPVLLTIVEADSTQLSRRFVQNIRTANVLPFRQVAGPVSGPGPNQWHFRKSTPRRRGLRHLPGDNVLNRGYQVLGSLIF